MFSRFSDATASENLKNMFHKNGQRKWCRETVYNMNVDTTILPVNKGMTNANQYICVNEMHLNTLETWSFDDKFYTAI